MIFLVVLNLFVSSLGLRTPMGGKRIRTKVQTSHRSTSGFSGSFGLDVSGDEAPTISNNSWKCMVRGERGKTKRKKKKKKLRSFQYEQGNYTFAIIEGWRGGYQMTKNLAEVTQAAASVGMATDVYAFMCPNVNLTQFVCFGKVFDRHFLQCNNSPSSVQSLVEYLRSNGAKFSRIWLDVEQCNGCWHLNLSDNCAFVQSLAQAYSQMGVNIGIYASNYEWSKTVGSSCRMDQYELWYADYDHEPVNFEKKERKKEKNFRF